MLYFVIFCVIFFINLMFFVFIVNGQLLMVISVSDMLVGGCGDKYFCLNRFNGMINDYLFK